MPSGSVILVPSIQCSWLHRPRLLVFCLLIFLFLGYLLSVRVALTWMNFLPYLISLNIIAVLLIRCLLVLSELLFLYRPFCQKNVSAPLDVGSKNHVRNSRNFMRAWPAGIRAEHASRFKSN